jgi:hypothetical protein
MVSPCSLVLGCSAVVLLDLRRRLKDEYGDTPAAMMLIDRAVSACQDFMRSQGGWAIWRSVSSMNSLDMTGPAHNSEIATAGRVARSVDSPWRSPRPFA